MSLIESLIFIYLKNNVFKFDYLIIFYFMIFFNLSLYYLGNI